MRFGPAHAEKGPGGKPRAIAGKLPTAAKAAGRALPTGGRVMLEECGPLGDQGAALTATGDLGAHLGQ